MQLQESNNKIENNYMQSKCTFWERKSNIADIFSRNFESAQLVAVKY